MKMHTIQTGNGKRAWSQLSLAVRMTIALNLFLISSTYATDINLKYLCLRSGNEKITFEDDFRFCKENIQINSLLPSPKDSNYFIV